MTNCVCVTSLVCAASCDNIACHNVYQIVMCDPPRHATCLIVFFVLGLSHAIYTAVIRKGYKLPTPIQRKVGSYHWGVVKQTHVSTC